MEKLNFVSSSTDAAAASIYGYTNIVIIKTHKRFSEINERKSFKMYVYSATTKYILILLVYIKLTSIQTIILTHSQ